MRTPLVCARELIGCRIEWRGCSGIVVETEAYDAVDDRACHTHARPGARRFVEEHEAGTAYVYLNYGMHWLFNLLVRGEERSGFVLFRALEPVGGLRLMRARRNREDVRQLCSGPGKLTQALGIDGAWHGREVLSAEGIQLSPDREVAAQACKRVGITMERDLPWRFLAAGSEWVSRPP